jgi:pilus assembly protein CpaF
MLSQAFSEKAGEDEMEDQLNEFFLDEYLAEYKNKAFRSMAGALDTNTRFEILCDKVKSYLDEEWERENNRNNTEVLVERQKKAILGYAAEVNYYKDKIREFLKANNLEAESFPSWFRNLVDAIFHQNWGIAGIEPWMRMPDSSSAKIIGDRIYFFINGKMELQPQKISPQRFEQLRRALIMSDTSKRLDDNYTEVYMVTGERVIIYTGNLVVEGQNTIVFRKYIVEALTFDEQARRHTIPECLIPAFEAMVKMGVRIAFVGPVRSGKSTMLTTFQMYEDKTLEGLFIQTDPEIRINEIMPGAPIMSLIADGEEASSLPQKVVRSDADYVVVAEGRDGYAYNLIIESANKGTIRNKTTLHLSDVEDFAYDLANKIVTVYGGNLDYQIVKVAKSFDYIFEMAQLPERKNEKRLKSIYELRYDRNSHEISYHRICQYDHVNDSWGFYYDVGEKVRDIGSFENPAALQIFENTLKELSQKYPVNEHVLKPVYSNSGDKGGDRDVQDA